MAKSDSNFVYYKTKNMENVEIYQSEICAVLRTKGSTIYTKAHTCKKKKAAS
jgi:hypothetical protein